MSTEGRGSERMHYLTFRLAQELYAVDVRHAREVIELHSLSRMPNAPPWIRGFINLRGAVVPVIDVRLKFGMGETPIAARTRVVIVELGEDGDGMVVGVLVDAATDVLEIEAREIQPPPRFGARFSRAYVHGMVRRDDRVLVVLDAQKVFEDTPDVIVDEEQAQPAPGEGAAA
jgi:purine-binding chemotaxis protein CheW